MADPLFRDSAFFDPSDLVQVKYEMLRSVERDGRAVVEAAEAFGLSRPVYYVARELFNREGLPGLLPRKRGPKRPHKLTEETVVRNNSGFARSRRSHDNNYGTAGAAASEYS